LCQFVPNINVRAVQQDVQDSMGSARVVAELVREPHAICSGVIKIRRTMGVASPHEAEYQAMGSEMVNGPGLDVVELDELESMNAESAGKGGEYRWVRLDDGERPANEVVLLRLLWLLFIDLHVEQLRVVVVCTRCPGLLLASCQFPPFPRLHMDRCLENEEEGELFLLVEPTVPLILFHPQDCVGLLWHRNSVLGLEFNIQCLLRLLSDTSCGTFIQL
jgi:hypothetical protein